MRALRAGEKTVLAMFEEAELVDEPDFPSGEQLALLAEVLGVYADRGLIRGADAPPLWQCCPRHGECWRGLDRHRPSVEDGRSSVSLPWIGPMYRPGGVCLIAINLNDAGGPTVEYGLTCASGGNVEEGGRGSTINRFEAGYKQVKGSGFAYGATRAAAAAGDWLAGLQVSRREDPRELVEPLQAMARLQAVKCSPEDGERSHPTPVMSQNCPELLLVDELRVLRPGAIVTVGSEAYYAVRALDSYHESGYLERLEWGTIRLSQDHSIPVFCLDHPVAAAYWHIGLRELFEQLPKLDAPRS